MTINLISTQHSSHHAQIEWDVLSRIISQFAYFETNKLELCATLYIDRQDELVEEYNQLSSYRREFMDEYRQVLTQLFSKLPSDQALIKHLTHVSKRGVLNFTELNKLALLVECAQFIKQGFPKLNLNQFQALRQLDHGPINRKFLKEFRHLVDDSGEVHFEKHPELAELTRRLRELEERIRRTVQEWINDPAHSKCLQYLGYDVHYDRYVVPVRSDSYRSELGLIISRSESGQTLFIEPVAVREACNRRMELIAKIDEIINQLARKFSFALSDFSDLLEILHKLLLKIDHYTAKLEFSQQYQLERPKLREKPGFNFSGLFHPLLKIPTKNDAFCGKDHHGIVISGPNTGGKTVFLKSLALSYLLFYHGFFVPASDAEMFPYEGLFYFGNDLQDLKTGLSSFSGEVKNYIELIEHIGPSNLVLIDEIFNSTSSDEASALSLAYFEELHSRSICHLVVSTHHQMFKTLIHQDKNYVSCHVGFDTKNMKPTYKVQWGTPGSSMAIDIFRILSQGHSEVADVPDRALKYLNIKNVSYETLLQKVSQKQIELDQLLTSNRQLELGLKNQKGAMEGVLNLRLQDELNKASREIERILNEARNLVEVARRNEITKIRKVDEKSHQLKSQLSKLKNEEITPRESYYESNLRLEELKVGDLVHSHVLRRDFVVHTIDLRKREVTIAKGPIKLNVPAETLSHARLPPSQRAQVTVSFQKNSNAQLELDARGMRLSEFQNNVELALGNLLTGDVPFINVIHGHGDGVLKKWLRDHLKRSKDFKSELPDNGNDGETKVTLK